MKRGGSGGSAPSKKKKRQAFKYAQALKHSKLFINPDEKNGGFLVTFDTKFITLGINEALKVLGYFADKFYGPYKLLLPKETEEEKAKKKSKAHNDAESEDDEKKPPEEGSTAAAPVEMELREVRRFHIYESGVAGIMGFKLIDPAIEPVVLAKQMCECILSKDPEALELLRKLKSLNRLVPVDAFCPANDADVKTKAGPVIAKALGPDVKPPRKFAIAIKTRGNANFPRKEAIDVIASIVDPSHKVDLSNPDVFIVADVFKSCCSITVTEDYERFKKYNLHELLALAQPPKEEEEEKEKEETKPNTEEAK